MEQFYVTTDHRENTDLKMFIADKRIHKNNFWTYFLDKAFVFRNWHAANAKAKRLKHNNPQVISHDAAKTIAMRNIQILDATV